MDLDKEPHDAKWFGVFFEGKIGFLLHSPDRTFPIVATKQYLSQTPP